MTDKERKLKITYTTGYSYFERVPPELSIEKAAALATLTGVIIAKIETEDGRVLFKKPTPPTEEK